MRFLLFLAAFGSAIGGLYLFLGIAAAKSAPQEAAVAAYAIAFAVIPYVFARACQLWGQADTQKQRHAEVLSAMRALVPTQAPAPQAAAPAPVTAEPAFLVPTAPKGKCPNCGHANLLESLICTKCGALFEEGSAFKLERIP